METTGLVCDRCKAPLVYEEGSDILRCPHCGYIKKINESDDVSIERIKAKAYKETELGKRKIEAEANIEQQKLHIEEKNIFNKRIIIGLVVAAVVLVFTFVGIGISRLSTRIKHRNDVRIPMAASSYCKRDYEETKRLLIEAGFNEELINFDETADLKKSEESKKGIVTQISVQGRTSFAANEWFSKNSPITITYHVLDPAVMNHIRIPLSFSECKGTDYRSVKKSFYDAGFTNINEDTQEILDKTTQDQSGQVTGVTVDGRTSFSAEDYYSPDAKIVITYKVMNPEKINDVQLTASATQYVGRDYIEVCKDLVGLGFSDITLRPTYDIKKSSDQNKGLVTEVSIAKDTTFTKGAWISPLSKVEISYRDTKPDFEGELYSEVSENLYWIGFTDIKQIALKDLTPKNFKKDGQIANVLINGKPFEDAETLALSSKITINYHSKQEATSGQVQITISSKDLKEKDYKEAVRELKTMGFTNVQSKESKDIVAEIGVKQGQVKSISIGDAKSFVVGDIFKRTDKVVVEYHSKIWQ